MRNKYLDNVMCQKREKKKSGNFSAQFSIIQTPDRLLFSNGALSSRS